MQSSGYSRITFRGELRVGGAAISSAHDGTGTQDCGPYANLPDAWCGPYFDAATAIVPELP